MMQYLTNSFLKSTPHKVGLNNQERDTIAYFHEPNFRAVVKPLEEYSNCNTSSSAPQQGSSPAANEEGIHYGTHFTNMFMRNYPERITANRIRSENRMKLLESPELRWAETPETPNIKAEPPMDAGPLFGSAQSQVSAQI